MGVCAWIWGGMGKVCPIQGAIHHLLSISVNSVISPILVTVICSLSTTTTALRDYCTNSPCLAGHTLLLRHPIKRISTSSGLTATPVAAGLIKWVSKCLIQRLMPPRELWDENGEKEGMVGWSVWGAREISMPQGSHTKEMKLTCFLGDMPYQKTTGRQKLYEILCCPVRGATT